MPPMFGNPPKPKAAFLSIAKKEVVAPTPAADDPMPPAEEKPDAGMAPGDAWFSSDQQTCARCEYFDDTGVGACRKGVPEADYSVTDPAMSRCRFFESGGEADKPAAEAMEAEPVEVGA